MRSSATSFSTSTTRNTGGVWAYRYLTLFNIITLEGWTIVMENAMELHSWSWVYFVSYVVAGTFVVINLFIAIIINNLDEAKAERLSELEPPVSREDLLRAIAYNPGRIAAPRTAD